MKRVAIVVGHNSYDQGAENYNGTSEWEFNVQVTEIIKTLTLPSELEIVILYRNAKKSYSGQVREIIRECKEAKVDYVICLHFNDASGDPRGCEVLVANTDYLLDDDFAIAFTQNLNSGLGIKIRRGNGIYDIDESHNGGTMIYGLTNAGFVCCLVEPCFARRSPESEAVFENPERYAGILINSILQGFKIEQGLPALPPQTQDLTVLRNDSITTMKMIRDTANDYLLAWE